MNTRRRMGLGRFALGLALVLTAGCSTLPSRISQADPATLEAASTVIEAIKRGGTGQGEYTRETEGEGVTLYGRGRVKVRETFTWSHDER